jgi:hypothetical protein
MLVLFLVFMYAFNAIVDINSTATSSTIVKVDPALIEYSENAVGEEFTVAIKIVDVTNLYGFDIRFRWNTTFLDYVSHSVRIPRDTNLDGVLWNPILEVKNEVNATTGTYWIACSSMHPAPSFNGSGTVFTMTFRVVYHPMEPEPTANIKLELYSTDLVEKNANKITHTIEDGTVILYSIAMHTRMYIDPRKIVSDVSGVYESRPTVCTTGGVAQPYYFHNETTTISGTPYYMLLPATGDISGGITLSASMSTPGRKLWGKTVFPLSGVASMSGATWTFRYRTWYDASPTGGYAHVDVDVLIRRADGTIRTTVATEVAVSTNLTSTATTRAGTYSFTAYTVVDQTDYLEVDYYLHAISAVSKNAYLRIDDSALGASAQTRIENPTMAPLIMNPSNAYDGNDATYTSFLTNVDGTIDFKTFYTTFPETDVAQVDINIRYQTLRVAGGDDRFGINQTVSPSTTQSTLQEWTTSDTEVPLNTYAWSYRTEPNDGIWSWTDVSNIIVRFQSDVVRLGENREIRIYEVWATVYDKPFTINLRAELVTDLYNWTAKISWNPTIIDLPSLSEGSFLTGPEGTIFTSTLNRTAGYANLSEQISGEYQGVSGAGILARFTFKVLKEGKSSIALSETSFLNSALEPIEHAAESGSFNTPAYHDIAITDILLNKNRVYQGENLLFNVFVKNKGTYTESFTVYCYANSTLINSKTVTDLVSDAETILSCDWNTSDYARGNYILKTNTSTVEGDYNTANNTFTYSAIRVKFRGDINDDGKVDVNDLFQLGKAFGSTGGPPPSPSWNPDADLNGDNIVDSLDLSTLNGNYGKTA